MADMEFDGRDPAPRAKRSKSSHVNCSDTDDDNQAQSQCSLSSQQDAQARKVPRGSIALSNGAAAGPALSPNSDDVSLEVRSCESCRRSKLKCSRTHPCTKCTAKGVLCVYDEEKRRGPKPGYIEDLSRRINDLENMVLGQALMLNMHHSTRSNVSFGDVVDSMRRKLTASGSMHSQGVYANKTYSEEGHGSNGSVLSSVEADKFPTESSLRHMCDVYLDQVQPWIPMIHRDSLFASVASSVGAENHIEPVLQAVMAATDPLIDGASTKSKKYQQTLQQAVYQRLLSSADLSQIQSAVVLGFLMCAYGTISKNWGLVTHLTQAAIHAGLHLEEEHLTTAQREYRRLTNFTHSEYDWASTETVRRVFWNIFLLDQVASIFSGLAPHCTSSIIQRRLPCDGQNWADNQQVETRNFVPAAVAVNMELSVDSNIGGFAYLIEATEILSLVASFAATTAKEKILRSDLRGFLEDFLNFDLVLTNWKSRLPPRYQRASYNKNGYMDHNITLAHLSHNTSVILLYQTSRHLHELGLINNHGPSSWLPQIHFVKDAAKEISKICTRFLLHRRYLVSAQFTFCQFIAARALLAYSSWTMERVDEDLETLHTSLVESSKRCNGLAVGHDSTSGPVLPTDFASALLARLARDMQRTNKIDLSTPCFQLLLDTSTEMETTTFTPTTIEDVAEYARANGEIHKVPGGANLVSSYTGERLAGNSSNSMSSMSEFISGRDGPNSLFASRQFEEAGDRIFKLV